ncbi:type II secretion system protein GspL [Oceanicoccus sp. KOV_DT_Chl]|uniref:type II secretion system protein GspL n=1 Tax=Oceanicoccus sp. KOV_DT_Chl TaxID=1904639 RepID=UPI000C7D9BDC|nr:type II secretion system protein GspL [Oceanicoccus sp. KOV_DT_Chl]
MASTLLIKPCGIDNYEWLSIDQKQTIVGDPLAELQVGDGERLAQACAANSDAVFLVAAEAVSIKEVAFDEHERKLLRQTIPYTLEEDCLEDVDNVHFALGKVGESTVPLALVSRRIIEESLAGLERQEIAITQLVSELFYLPVADNSWTLMVEADRWLVRVGAYHGFAMDAETASFALQLLLDEAEELPLQLTVYCAADREQAVLNQLPEMLRGIADFQIQDYWQIIADGVMQSQLKAKAINLLQGDFAPSLPWKKWWMHWRIAGFMFLAVTVLQFASVYTQKTILESRNVELRAQIERAYRSAVPVGAVMDAEKQLRRKVNSLKGSAGTGFVGLLAQVGEVVASIDGLSVQSLNYTEKDSEIRLTILAAGFNDVETARAKLEKLGLKAELTGSNAEGDKTRARLKVRS